MNKEQLKVNFSVKSDGGIECIVNVIKYVFMFIYMERKYYKKGYLIEEIGSYQQLDRMCNIREYQVKSQKIITSTDGGITNMTIDLNLN